MKIKLIYPEREKKQAQRRDFINALKWPFLLALYACPLLNLFLGGKAWSVIVVWGLWMLWSLVLSPAMVEYNRMSQVIKLVADACIMLVLIDVLLSPGWAAEVVPIVCFGGLVLAGLLFFTDLPRQKQNMMPMLILISASFIAAVICIIVWRNQQNWAPFVMGAVSLALFIACFIALGGDMVREYKKRFHTK